MGTQEINWRKNLFYTWLAQILSIAGVSMAMPFIPVYMRVKFGIEDPNLRGWYVSLFNLASMVSFTVFTPIWGVLADKYGRKLMLLRACIGAGLLMPLMGFAPSLWTLILLRFITSIFSGTATAAQTLIASCTPVKNHGFALGVLSSSIWSGNMLGYLLGGFVVHLFGYHTAFLSCGCLYLIGAAIVIFCVKENFVPPVRKTEEKKRTIHLPRFSHVIWSMLLLFLVMAFARRFDEAYLALQVENIAGKVNTELHTGWISALAAAGGVIAGLCIGWLVDRFTPGKVAFPAILLSIVFVLVQGFAPNLGVLGGARFFTFITAGGLEPVFLAMLSKGCPDEKRGEVFGWSSSARTVGILLASLLGGGVIYHFGVRSVYVTAAFGYLLLIPLVIHVIREIQKTTPRTGEERIES